MCGIHAVISAVKAGETASDVANITAELQRRLCRRGPDHFGQIKATVDSQVELCFSSSVLALRGGGVTKQPFHNDGERSILCWNGEAWAIDGAGVAGNDGTAIFQLLAASRGDEKATLDVMRSIEGPFAFVYFDRRAGKIYFGRDRLGRRSLLMHWGHDETTHLPRLSLSSVSALQDPQWTEVEADGIYVVDTRGASLERERCLVRHAWREGETMISGIGPLNMSRDPPAGHMLCADSPSVRGLHAHLLASLRPRLLNVPRPPSQELEAQANTADTRIAILFSGGLDCTVLARLCHELLPPQQGVDLINVAFENPRVASHLDRDVDLYEACPDRITGKKSFAELQRVCPRRAWRFLAVNVPYTETVSHRPEIISIMHPHNTEMDLSIASALYFAARGVGECRVEQDAAPSACATPARVLLSGLGADELFGGYGRHQIAFARRGYGGLVDELLLDVSRLGQRNLGRDDRVMAHWGKEVRFPFLDEHLVRWAMTLAAWEKCDFGNSDGNVEPAKRILRLVALSLGMDCVAREKKRAIQFGARTAKMEDGRVKGTATVS